MYYQDHCCWLFLLCLLPTQHLCFDMRNIALPRSIHCMVEGESPTCRTSCHNDVVRYSVAFFPVASLFSEVTLDSRPKRGKIIECMFVFNVLKSNLV